VALVPELDDYLRPDEARGRLARVPQAEVIGVERARHLWVGERYVRIVLNEIVRRVNPAAWPLPESWPPPGQTPPGRTPPGQTPPVGPHLSEDDHEPL
jgi:uncharacterized protein